MMGLTTVWRAKQTEMHLKQFWHLFENVIPLFIYLFLNVHTCTFIKCVLTLNCLTFLSHITSHHITAGQCVNMA